MIKKFLKNWILKRISDYASKHAIVIKFEDGKPDFEIKETDKVRFCEVDKKES